VISRFTRTVQTLALVLLAYAAYALLAVPLIEPTIELAESVEWESNSRGGVSQTDLTLFPDDAWERGQPKILETNQGTLLFDDYQQLENGDLRLPRCTLISYIDPPSDKDAAPRSESADGANVVRPPTSPPRPVVMRASEGAVLSFDPPPNFMLGKFGRLVGGKLQGNVTIFSPASNNSENDALRITTKNIQIDQKRIWAPSQVDFRFGANRARGRDLSIYFEPAQGPKKSAMGRIHALELVHVDEVHLEVAGDLLALATGDSKSDVTERDPAQSAPGNPSATRSASVAAPELTAPPAMPIEIKCEGPFRFDFDALIASLEERVDVIRHNLDGHSDQLNCELLEIHLMPKDTDSTAPAPADSAATPLSSRPGAMQPKKIIAVGFPVMIRATSMQAGARAKRIEYDFITRRVELNGEENATLFRDQFFVEAPRLEYELLEGGRLGRLQAAGPGQARGQMGKDKRPFDATWNGNVSLLPQGKNKVLSVVGQAHLNMDGVASLKAEELHLYLLEVPRPGGDEVDVHADRMQARGQIELDSPQLIAYLTEAQIWFREPTAAETAAANTNGQPDPRTKGLLGGKSTIGAATDDERPKKLQLTAGVLRGQVVMTKSPQLEALDLQNDVRINEFQPLAKSSLDIAGQRVILEHGNTPTAELTLTGAPARFSAEGMALDGTLIRVQLANNVAEVEGPGSMLMLPKHVAIGASGQAKPLNVHWQKGMRFDGQTARFEGQIETRGGHVTKSQDTVQFVASGETLEVILNRPIKFNDPATNGIDARRLSFRGHAQVDSQTMDQTGTVTSVDSLVVRDLLLDRQTGNITGQGPGYIIHRGPNPEKKKNPPAGPSVPELAFLRVDFENELAGNIDQREIQFLNGTRTILGPIYNWEQSLDPQRPDLLGPKSVILTSRRLAVADMRDVVGDENAIEVEATGNAQIRGNQFAATGNRVSYVRAKDQLVMEGDARTKSTLEFQRQAGAAWQKLSAARILFYPETSQFALNDFELELNDLGISSPTSATTAPPADRTPSSQVNAPANFPAQAYRNRGTRPPN